MNKIFIQLIVCTWLASPLHANAQRVWSAELRAAANLPLDDSGEIVENTDNGAGFEFGDAVAYSDSDKLSLIPGIRYRFLTREVAFESTNSKVDPSHVVLDVGVA